MGFEKMELGDFHDLVWDYSGHVCDYCNGQGCGHCKGTGEEHWTKEDTIEKLEDDNYIIKCEECDGDGCDACGEIGYLAIV